MNYWFDAQLSPQLAPWLAQRFGVTAQAVRDLGLRDALDRDFRRGTCGWRGGHHERPRFSRSARTFGTTATSDLGHVRKHLEYPHAPDLRSPVSAGAHALQGGNQLVEITDLP